MQPPLAATLSTLKPCCSSYVCTLFLLNFIYICHCQLQPERIPVASSVSEKSLNWRQCLPRSVRIVGPLKLSQTLQGSINCCSGIVLTSFLIVIFVILFLHVHFHDCMKLFDCENIINQVKMVITTLPRCTLFTRSVIFIFKVVVYNRHKYHVNHRIQSERLLTVPIFATMEITKNLHPQGRFRLHSLWYGFGVRNHCVRCPGT